MTKLRFDNRVAIVTGAGNGLGKAYAQLLHALGANVVVNDPAKTRDDTAAFAADKVVEGLKTERALASYDSVERGDAIVEAALKKWGRVDILINNAGIVRDASFARMTKQQWDDVTRVHLEGTMNVTKACWDVMREQHYGRIVNVSSASGLYGNFGQANYSAAKLGIAGFTFTLSKEGEKRNVLANVVAPLAASQMTDGIVEEELFERLRPELVSPFVTYLCHERCNRTGNVYEVGAGWVSQVRWQRSEGVLFPPDDMTLENIADQIHSIEDFSRGASAYPRSLQDSLAHVRSLVLDRNQ